MIAALQRGLPLEADPFEHLAREAGCSSSDLIACVADLRARGLVRRFGAVFDTRRLGYRSALCAAVVPPDALDEAAARVTPLGAVTHCYRRVAAGLAGAPELWFTLSAPADVFPALSDEVTARLAPYPVHILPAIKRYKVDVVFGAAVRTREESVEDDLGPLSASDRAIIAALQGDTEVRPDYFAAVASSLGMAEWDLLSRLELWRRNGRLKRIGLLLHHRRAGFVANGMCCWSVEGDTDAAGRALAACPEVTHCYARPRLPGFPYDLYAMIHCKTRDEAEAVFARLSEAAGLPPGVMLVSEKEYKKTSMTFFAPPAH